LESVTVRRKACDEMRQPMIETSEEKGTGSSKPSGTVVKQHIVELVSDSGEGAQTCGQMFGTIGAKMGNGVWTVEIIPAEVEPPHRSRAGASGNRIRLGAKKITNAGDTADVVVAFNEQVLYSRIDVDALKPGTLVFLDRIWGESPQEEIREAYEQGVADFRSRGYVVIEVPMEEECLNHTDQPRRGKNMWALGMLCAIYERDLELARAEIVKKFTLKGEKVIATNLALLDSGYEWASKNVPHRFVVPVETGLEERVVMNGNQAVGLGIMAAGMELCAMYPITPATSASHYLATVFHEAGGFIHQAEDEIAAVGFALGATYAGKTAVTITSGPGLALKTEFLGLAVMAELPLVVVVVQRGGPSTGLPTKIEQGDLLASLFGSPGDSPKIIVAPATIEECFHFMTMSRKLAEEFRGPVLVLTDANLATGQQPFPRPKLQEEWLSPPVDQSQWNPDIAPFHWDPETGLSKRPIPGQRGGEYVLTGLAHDQHSHVAYESAINQKAMAMRSRKLAVLKKSLKPPEIHGDSEGDLLVVSWGSTLGAVEEAVDRIREDGGRVSSLHLRFLCPLPPGLKDIFQKFKNVMTVEINYSDDADAVDFDPGSRRRAQLCRHLRSKLIMDIGCWSRVPGNPLPPGVIESVLRKRLGMNQ
jgi:2-oxoglutarate ferredoxin oxidoreductase subunit alpha